MNSEAGPKFKKKNLLVLAKKFILKHMNCYETFLFSDFLNDLRLNKLRTTLQMDYENMIVIREFVVKKIDDDFYLVPYLTGTGLFNKVEVMYFG